MTDDTIRELRALAEAAAASVPQPLDLIAYETALVREAEAEIARQGIPVEVPLGAAWQERIRRAAEAVSRRQRHRR
jgi:hypothetical protein